MKFRTKLIILVMSNVVCWLVFFAYIARSDSIPQMGVAILGMVISTFQAAVIWIVFSGASKALQDLLRTTNRILAGDMTPQPRVRRSDEIGAIGDGVEQIAQRILQVVSSVRIGTSNLVITAGNLTTDNRALSSRTETQGALLEETAASTEELTSTVKLNADSAERARQFVLKATATAHDGAEVRSAVEVTMAEIQDSSRKIANIIDVVNKISFQTKVLALNAAVEAARAGDSGRGFAVVASEVKSLAQNVADASKEIQGLIEDSMQKVAYGTKLVSGANETMNEIIESVEQVAVFMADISNSTREQSEGIDTINNAVVNLDQMTNHNSDLVQVIARTAENLKAQSMNLNGTLQTFNLGTEELGTKDDALNLVNRAIKYAEQAGVPALSKSVNDMVERRFSDRDLYLVLISMDGHIVAHGANQRLLHEDARKLKDPDGKKFGEEMLRVASRGEGWVEHKFTHPVTQDVRSKATFVKRVGNVLVSCGYYKDEPQAATRQPPAIARSPERMAIEG